MMEKKEKIKTLTKAANKTITETIGTGTTGHPHHPPSAITPARILEEAANTTLNAPTRLNATKATPYLQHGTNREIHHGTHTVHGPRRPHHNTPCWNIISVPTTKVVTDMKLALLSTPHTRDIPPGSGTTTSNRTSSSTKVETRTG